MYEQCDERGKNDILQAARTAAEMSEKYKELQTSLLALSKEETEKLTKDRIKDAERMGLTLQEYGESTPDREE